MKRRLIYYRKFLWIIILIPVFVFAQKPRIENLPKFDLKPYHFGFALCLNKMDFSIRTAENYVSDSLFVIESDPQLGFNIGIVSDLRLGEFSNLRFIPTLSFGQRNLIYTLSIKDSIVKTTKKIESTFIDFPLMLKYTSKRLNNFRAYIIGGAQYSIDLASQAKKKDKENDLVKLKQNDICCDLGVGFEFYLNYFKLTTELKMIYGMRDMLKRDNTVYTTSIDRINSKIFQLSFLFE
ncbi:MAG TPA: porin family protein [Bacteroidales bacterium]|nr:porin family protein [Bacteroidales bacterium]HPS17970.1 porin family protein [Bacteroidales bacterium]